MILESGVRVELKLKPGDCKITENEETDEIDDPITTTLSSSFETTTIPSSIDENRRNSISYEEVDSNNLPWKPIIPSTPSYPQQKNQSQTQEKTILEPVVIIKPKREIDKTENRTRLTDKRSFEVASPASHPHPLPVEMKVKKTVKNRTDENSTENKSIMVQLFPIRIASMFEKAERYARQTILPYLTEQFPTFFKTPSAIFDADLMNDTNIIEDSRYVVDTLETVKPEKRAFKTTQTRARRKMDKLDDYIHQYKNLSGIRTIFDDDDANESNKSQIKANVTTLKTATTAKNETDIRKVDLPTFKPPAITTRIPKYIPLERRRRIK